MLPNPKELYSKSHLSCYSQKFCIVESCKNIMLVQIVHNNIYNGI